MAISGPAYSSVIMDVIYVMTRMSGEKAGSKFGHEAKKKTRSPLKNKGLQVFGNHSHSIQALAS